MVEEFEHEFAAFCNAKYCVAVNSGTDALRFAFMAAGVESGDIIVTVPHTFIATTEAISQAGAQLAFVDIHEQTYTMDPEKLRDYFETRCDFDRTTGKLIEHGSARRVAGIVPVHLYGQMADMDPIQELAEKYNLFVIEDACQAHGAEYFSKRENTWKHAGPIGKAAGWTLSQHSNSHAGITMAAMIHLAASIPELTMASDTHYPWLPDDADIVVVARPTQEMPAAVVSAAGSRCAPASASTASEARMTSLVAK